MSSILGCKLLMVGHVGAGSNPVNDEQHRVAVGPALSFGDGS